MKFKDLIISLFIAGMLAGGLTRSGRIGFVRIVSCATLCHQLDPAEALLEPRHIVPVPAQGCPQIHARLRDVVMA